MLHRPKSRTLFVGAACLALAAMPGPAPADVYFETAYVPTSSVLGLSPSLLPTSYVVPTAYSTTYVPTSYLPTSSVVTSDSVVYPTSTTYIRRSVLRPRRYVERTYSSYPLSSTAYLSPTSSISDYGLLPTTYLRSYAVAPTSYLVDSSLIATSASTTSYPCDADSTPSPSRPIASRPSISNQGGPGNTVVSTPSNAGPAEERRPQGILNGEEGMSSAVTPPVPAPVPGPAAKPESANPAATPPLEEMKPDKVKLPEPGTSGGSQPQAGEATFRTSRRPAYDGRSILRGRVISAETRRPEEGVTVIVSNVMKNFSDRPAMTDAFGEFNVSLPDGDWTVKVKMPSGTVYQVGRDFVTASNGRVTDASGRGVAEFLITR